YANSEDGNLYVIPQGHTGVFSAASSVRFLNLALGAAYTPLSIGPDGKLYTQNAGHLFVVGNLKNGAPGEIRTPDLTLRRTCRANNQRVSWDCTNLYPLASMRLFN